MNQIERRKNHLVILDSSIKYLLLRSYRHRNSYTNKEKSTESSQRKTPAESVSYEFYRSTGKICKMVPRISPTVEFTRYLILG